MIKLVVAVVLLMSSAARADVDAYFATGVLEVPWGSTMPKTMAEHPGGTAWPYKSHDDGEGYVYEVTGDFRPLGLNCFARHVHFLFSKDGKLDRISMHFSYADREEVLYGIAQVLGQNYEIREEKNSRIFAWKPGRHSEVGLVVSSDPNLPWTYLTVRRR